jgi:two-component system phosphate regulon sensor histidine kinase PhoR
MAATILVIVAFQVYWIHKLYDDEWLSLKKRTDVVLKETVQAIQAERIKHNNMMIRPGDIESIRVVKDPEATFRKSLGNRPQPKFVPKANVQFRDGKVTMVMSADTGMHFTTMRRSGGMPPNVDSLIAKVRASGQMVQVMMKDSLKPEGVVRMMEEAAIADGIPKKELKTFTRVQTNDKKGRANFIQVRGDKKVTTAFVSDSAQYRIIVSQFKSIIDSIPMKKLDSHYHAWLLREGIKLPYTLSVKRFDSAKADSVSPRKLVTNYALVGFNKPYGYQATFDNPFNYIMGKLVNQILVSFFLVAITMISFITMYRNLLAQQRLTNIKNDFISNITHELKTPIATVGVAIEALRNFNAINDPAKTKEYLDISASELQRLSLLVDKVLKLSMFENKEINLKKEHFDLKQLVEEVAATMRLQFEKVNAQVSIVSDVKSHTVLADKLHITSVIYNLLDNALKYSPVDAAIKVEIVNAETEMILKIADNGIGIPDEYRGKIFEKFFRVPTNDHHNIKGYGLGLSYVCHIIKKHGGDITVENASPKGSIFIVKLPVA